MQRESIHLDSQAATTVPTVGFWGYADNTTFFTDVPSITNSGHIGFGTLMWEKEGGVGYRAPRSPHFNWGVVTSLPGVNPRGLAGVRSLSPLTDDGYVIAQDASSAYGVTRLYRVDPSTSSPTFTALTSAPINVTPVVTANGIYPSHWMANAAIGIDDYIIIFARGGSPPSYAPYMQMYNVHTNAWTTGLTLPPVLVQSPAIASDREGNIYLIGGYDLASYNEVSASDNQILGVVQRYTHTTDTWEILPSVAYPKNGSQITTLDGIVGAGAVFYQADLYPANTQIGSNSIYVFGGTKVDSRLGQQFDPRNVLRYDVEGASWDVYVGPVKDIELTYGTTGQYGQPPGNNVYELATRHGDFFIAGSNYAGGDQGAITYATFPVFPDYFLRYTFNEDKQTAIPGNEYLSVLMDSEIETINIPNSGYGITVPNIPNPETYTPCVGVTVTESFNKSDSTVIGPDLVWTKADTSGYTNQGLSLDLTPPTLSPYVGTDDGEVSNGAFAVYGGVGNVPTTNIIGGHVAIGYASARNTSPTGCLLSSYVQCDVTEFTEFDTTSGFILLGLQLGTEPSVATSISNFGFGLGAVWPGRTVRFSFGNGQVGGARVTECDGTEIISSVSGGGVFDIYEGMTLRVEMVNGYGQVLIDNFVSLSFSNDFNSGLIEFDANPDDAVFNTWTDDHSRTSIGLYVVDDSFDQAAGLARLSSIKLGNFEAGVMEN